jgi:phospholipid-binding lipoprotein MlaA
MRKMRAAVVTAAATLALAACSTVQTPSKQDPFESFNRTMFTFNDKLDTYALKPAATTYKNVVPQFARDRVSSFFSNLNDIYSAANNLLQGKITAGMEDVMRFAMNSTFGIGGLFDFASPAGLPKHQADFGMTMGHYGVPPGPYLVLPLFGPSTVRDSAGLLVDWQGDLAWYIRPIWIRTTLYGIRIVSTRASLLGVSELLSGAALDQYSFVRNAYLQRREYLIHGGDVPPMYDDTSGVDTGPTDTNTGPEGAPPPADGTK